MTIQKLFLLALCLFNLASVSLAESPKQDPWRKNSIARPYTLEECLEIALKNNPQLKAAGWRYQAAKEREKYAKGERWPSIKATGGYKYLTNPLAIIPSRFNGDTQRVFSDEFFSADLILTLPIFTGGRIINEIKAAELLKQSAQNQLARTRESLVFNVSSLFFSILAQEQVIRSLEFSKHVLQKHLEQVNNLISAQKAAPVDRLRTQVRIAHIDQAIVKAKNAMEIKLRALANTMGIELGARPMLIKGKLNVPWEPTPPLGQALSRALKVRADYAAAKAALEAQKKKVAVARSMYWPQVSLRGSYGMRWARDPELEPPGADDSKGVGEVAALISVPLFKGGRIRSKVREEQSRLAEAREQLRNLELQIRLEVKRALLDIASAQQRIRTTETVLKQAKESLRIEQEKYRLGKGSITDVLDAQSALLNSQTNYYRALADYRTALSELKFATGETK